MNAFPSEILSLVFLELDQENKLECMIVCKLWFRVILASCLYRSIKITRDTSFSSLYGTLCENRNRRSQVENLVFDILPHGHSEIETQLVTLLPLLKNLKLLYIGCNSLSYGSSFDLFPSSSERCSQVEQLIICPSMYLASDLFRDISFPHLRILKINGPFPMSYQIEKALSFWPMLSELSISNFNLSIGFLEQVHKLLPSIKSLTFRGVTLYSSQLTEEIEPANSLTSFRTFYQHDYFDEPAYTWIRYIGQKYPSLTHLALSRINENGWNSSSSRSIQASSFNHLFRHFGQHLKEFNFMLNQLPVGLFECLDNHGVKLEELDILASSLTQMKTSFINSTQLTFIKTLTLWGSYLGINYSILSSMPVLDDLTIVFLYDSGLTTEYIESILQGCPPSLTSLELDKCFLCCANESIFCFDKLNFIQRLVLSNITFSQRVDYFLSLHLSTTQELVLKNCIFYNRELNLPEFELDSLEVHHEGSGGKDYISVLTLEDERKERYTSWSSRAPIKSHKVYEYPDGFSPFPSTKRITDTHDYDPNLYQTVFCCSVRKVDLLLSD